MINYSIVSRKHPTSKQVKYYAQAISNASVDLNQLAREISAQCTVTIHDVKAVLSALEEHITHRLQNGNTVRLGDLGSFRITLRGEGADQASEYASDKIQSISVRFLCSRRMRNAFKVGNEGISFRRLGVRGLLNDLPADPNNPGGGNEEPDGGDGGLSPEE